MSSSSHHMIGAAAMWDLHASSISAWSPMLSNVLSINNYQHHLNPNSSSAKSCEEEDVLMASSALTTCSNELLTEDNTGDNHLWSHMIFSGDEYQNHNHRDVRSNLPHTVSTKSMTHCGMVFEPSACDYLNKFDSNKNYWDDDEKDYLREASKQQLSPPGLVFTDWSIAPLQDPNTYSNTTVVSSKYNTKMEDTPGVMSFGGRVSKPLAVDDLASRIAFELTNRSVKKSSQGVRNSSSNQAKGRRSGTIRTEGKRKQSDQKSCSESAVKKQKLEQQSSTTVTKPSKVAKVKLGDKIGSLQQIVSPYGKTDTASVLMEAIQHIKLLEEQVQLLVTSRPYPKTNSCNDPWVQKEVKLDLISRGFCLIPVSRVPQVYRENNTGSDYWMMTPYRGMFYR